MTVKMENSLYYLQVNSHFTLILSAFPLNTKCLNGVSTSAAIISIFCDRLNNPTRGKATRESFFRHANKVVAAEEACYNKSCLSGDKFPHCTAPHCAVL